MCSMYPELTLIWHCASMPLQTKVVRWPAAGILLRDAKWQGGGIICCGLGCHRMMGERVHHSDLDGGGGAGGGGTY